MYKKSHTAIIDGFKCYAPELAYQNDGFRAEIFDIMYPIEEKNFWFNARNKIISSLFKKYVGTGKDKVVLEIGPGNGFVLRELAALNYHLIGAEIYINGLKNIKKRLKNDTYADLIQLNALDMPFEEELDAVGAFDVLEHIEEDFKVIQEVYRSLKTNGKFFITVPKYQWMWSYVDDFLMHKRRYSSKELKNKLMDAGFEIVFSSSFVTVLFPVVMISRYLKKLKPKKEITIDDYLKEFQIPEWLNSLFYKCMLLESSLIKRNISLPFGNSLIVVAQKKCK